MYNTMIGVQHSRHYLKQLKRYADIANYNWRTETLTKHITKKVQEYAKHGETELKISVKYVKMYDFFEDKEYDPILNCNACLYDKEQANEIVEKLKDIYYDSDISYNENEKSKEITVKWD